MDTSAAEVAFDFPPYFRAYTDGRVERFFGTDSIPPSLNSPTGVSSKDILISPETSISARLFIPTTIKPHQKLPLLVYFHGGAFLIGSPFCPTYHNYLTSLVAEAKIIAVSVGYRLAPEHKIPIAYEDSWAALQWVSSHCNIGEGSEEWLSEHADFRQVFLAGDSAGGNIAHNMAMRAGIEGLGSMKLAGICLVQPYFWRKLETGGAAGEGDNKYWRFVCPATTGSDDRRINPAAESSLWRLGCSRVLVCVAERDGLRERGLFYCEELRKSGWGGELESVETKGEEHVFHLFNPNCEKAVSLLKTVASFMNQD